MRELLMRFLFCDFAAVQNVANGPSRHFAATQQTVAFGGKATVREELLIVPNLCARARYSDTGSISVGSSSGALEVEFCVHRIDN